MQSHTIEHKEKTFSERILKFFERYERHISTVALPLGFLFDNLTLTRIDLWLDNLVLIWYLLIALGSIFIKNLYDGGILRGRAFHHFSIISSIPIQYAFGGLFSGFTVFYLRSASLATNAFFPLLLLGLLVGNEFLRSRYGRIQFQLGIFFLTLFSYSVFAMPIIVGAVGTGIFVASGTISLILMACILYVLFSLAPEFFRGHIKSTAGVIGGVFIGMNILYLLNVIPPLPLSLKEAGAYHQVSRGGDGSYILIREDRPWYAFLTNTETVHVADRNPIYFFTSVFAPTRLHTIIVHDWQVYDDRAEAWRSVSRVSFSIVGGRDGGYRGYSLKTAPSPGRWRVNIETENGQLIGRKTLIVERIDELPPLVQEIL